MANVSAYAEKKLLDIILGSASGAALSLGVPTSISASEVGPGSGLSRASISFSSASSPAGSAVNNLAVTFGPLSAGSSASVVGITLWDNPTSSGAGSMLWYGLLASPRVLGPGDSLVLTAGALTVTLA
jgi:hypothetical protein